MAFAAAVRAPEDRLLFSFCFPNAQAAKIWRNFTRHLSSADLAHHPQVAALTIHGPHFGDRYGIANTLVQALENGSVSLLALACTVSSISGIVRKKDLAAAVRALDAAFQRSST
jgi:aspartokinase